MSEPQRDVQQAIDRWRATAKQYLSDDAVSFDRAVGAADAYQACASELELLVRARRPLQPSDVMAVQWKNDGDGGSLAAIKAIDDDDEIVFAADGTPALEIESPGRDVERVEVGDYVVRRVVGGLAAMKREVFEQTQRQIAEMKQSVDPEAAAVETPTIAEMWPWVFSNKGREYCFFCKAWRHENVHAHNCIWQARQIAAPDAQQPG